MITKVFSAAWDSCVVQAQLLADVRFSRTKMEEGKRGASTFTLVDDWEMRQKKAESGGFALSSLLPKACHKKQEKFYPTLQPLDSKEP
jgi:hypothetical protein